MSRRQPSLPGFPDIPDPIEVRIPTDMPWTQIGGDMDPGAHGGLIATADGDHIELFEIQPVRNSVGDKEAADVGYPFWSKEAWFDLSDLDPKNKDVQSALQSYGFDSGEQKVWFEEEATPEQRALVIAEALIGYGRGDSGPSGWSSDLPDYEVKWWGGKVATIPEYVADEDESFKNDVLGYSDIESALETAAQLMSNQSSAQAWSHVGDQVADDLESQGYDPESIVIIAEFGGNLDDMAVAVNEDVLIDRGWEEALGLPRKAHPQLWTDVGTGKLTSWLEQNGYEFVEYGGHVPASEGSTSAEAVIRAVAAETEHDEETVETVAQGLDWWPKRGDDEITWGTDGETSVWAKKKAGAEEAPRRARRRR